jgi:hypothetical protein
MRLPDDATLRELLPAARCMLLTEVPAADALRVLAATDGLGLEQTLVDASRRGTLGEVVKRCGLEQLLSLGAGRGLNLNDVLATSDTVPVRGLTSREARRVAFVFEGSLDPTTVRLNFTTGAQTSGAGALVLGNTIHVDPGDPRWQLARGTTLASHPEDEAWGSFNSVLLTHEPTHVWSYQHQGSRYAVNSVNEQLAAMQQGGSRDGAYTYSPGVPGLWDFGEEQRAMVVQDFIAAWHALRRGASRTPTRYRGAQPPADVVATLERYVRELRGSPPGQPQPPVAVERIFCPAARVGFEQDGALGAFAAQADQLIAATGRSALEGLHSRAPLEVAAGVAGVGVAAAASLLAREQSQGGASSGGSALLDKAGIPHGVSGDAGPFDAQLRAEWDAPATGHAMPTLGVKDLRVDAGVGATGEVGDARVHGHLSSTLDRDGVVKAGAELSAAGDTAEARARVELTPARGDAPLMVDAEAELTTPGVTATATASVVARAQVERVDATLDVETRAGTFSGEAHLARARPDAPLALERAEAAITVTPGPHLSLRADATVVPAGLDGLGLKVATSGEAGTLSLGAHGRDLTTTPRVGIDLAATDARSGVSVVATAEVTPSTGDAQVSAGVKVPLP